MANGGTSNKNKTRTAKRKNIFCARSAHTFENEIRFIIHAMAQNAIIMLNVVYLILNEMINHLFCIFPFFPFTFFYLLLLVAEQTNVCASMCIVCVCVCGVRLVACVCIRSFVYLFVCLATDGGMLGAAKKRS